MKQVISNCKTYSCDIGYIERDDRITNSGGYVVEYYFNGSYEGAATFHSEEIAIAFAKNYCSKEIK